MGSFPLEINNMLGSYSYKSADWNFLPCSLGRRCSLTTSCRVRWWHPAPPTHACNLGSQPHLSSVTASVQLPPKDSNGEASTVAQTQLCVHSVQTCAQFKHHVTGRGVQKTPLPPGTGTQGHQCLCHSRFGYCGLPSKGRPLRETGKGGQNGSGGKAGPTRDHARTALLCICLLSQNTWNMGPGYDEHTEAQEGARWRLLAVKQTRVNQRGSLLQKWKNLDGDRKILRHCLYTEWLIKSPTQKQEGKIGSKG